MNSKKKKTINESEKNSLCRLPRVARIINRKDQMQGDRYYSEHFVIQHDLLRELAIYETRQQDPGHRERLIINISGDNLPKWWSEKKYPSMKARLLSISTGSPISLYNNYVAMHICANKTHTKTWIVLSHLISVHTHTE